MNNQNQINGLKYRCPGDNGWKEIQKDEQAQENKSELKRILLSSLQMSNLIVLAGSGTSCEVGGPSMTGLWIDVNEGYNKTNSAGKKISMEDIMNKVGYNKRKDKQNIEKILSQCKAYLQIHSSDKEVENFVKHAEKIVLNRCRDFLTENVEKQVFNIHGTFLHRLSKRRLRDIRMKLFTTNYDLCFERAAGNRSIIANDGFSLTPPRTFNPNFFDYDIVRRIGGDSDSSNYVAGVFHLLKLHGSVNWERNDSNEIISHSGKINKACLIYPVDGKYQQSYTQPYLELFARYTAALREPNTCLLVIGCGFNDSHLAEPIVAAVRTNPKFRLIIVNRNAEKKIIDNEKDEKSYWHQFNELSRAGEDISFVNASFNTFTENIPDLQSLTPAQQLEKAIHGAKGGKSE